MNEEEVIAEIDDAIHKGGTLAILVGIYALVRLGFRILNAIEKGLK